MSEVERLRGLHDLALRLAAATTSRDARETPLSIAEQYSAEANALDDATEGPEDGPPLPAT